MFSTQSSWANLLTFSLLLGLSFMALFGYRSQSEAFYNAEQYYALGILALTLMFTLGYLYTLRPQLGREGEDTMTWYFGRALSMALLRTLLGALLVCYFIYVVDDSYLTRQLEWEAHRFEAFKVPAAVVDSMVDSARDDQLLHMEELTVLLFGSFSSLVGGFLLSCCFIGRTRRQARRHRLSPTKLVAGQLTV